MGLVNDKDKFEKDIKDTLEDVHEPVVSATLAEKPRYSLRLVDKEDIDVDDDYVFAKRNIGIIILKKMINFLQKSQLKKKKINL